MDINKLVVSKYSAVHEDGETSLEFMTLIKPEVIAVMRGLMLVDVGNPEVSQWQKSPSILEQELTNATLNSDPGVDEAINAVIEFGSTFVDWVWMKVADQEEVGCVWTWTTRMKHKLQAMASQIDQVRMFVVDSVDWTTYMYEDHETIYGDLRALEVGLENTIDRLGEMIRPVVHPPTVWQEGW